MLRIIDTISFVKNLVTKLYEERFYGSLELKFEQGTVVLVRKTETIKPS